MPMIFVSERLYARVLDATGEARETRRSELATGAPDTSGGANLSRRTVAAILSRTMGNPLYLSFLATSPITVH